MCLLVIICIITEGIRNGEVTANDMQLHCSYEEWRYVNTGNYSYAHMYVMAVVPYYLVLTIITYIRYAVVDISSLSVNAELVDEKTLTESVLLVHKVCYVSCFLFIMSAED